MELVTYVLAHAQDFLAILLAIHAVAVLIVNLTPTPKDNLWVAKAYSAIELVAGLVTKKAKQ